MKVKLSKKTKTFLWVATALATSTAVTTLLTSCSTANQNVINDIGGYDKDYGINDATYVRMEEDFKVLYKSQLDDKKRDGDIDDATYNLQLTTFQNKLNSLHTSLYSDENKTLSYTIRTNILRNFARQKYGIRLSRQSNVSLSVAISGIKNSIINSVLLLCKEYKITDADKYRKNAETEFDKLYKEAIAEYGEDDVVSVIQYVQTGMISCFTNISKELDCLATQQQLKDFISKYQICVKDDISKDYYWDKLFSRYGKGGKEISVEDFNSIFTMTYEETDPQSSSSSYFSTSKKTVEFKDDMITGYTLKPILVRMNGNASTNTYSIDVDYTLVNNNYKDTDDVAKLTAHSSCLKDKSVYDDENITIYDLNANESEREYTNYVLPITEEYEKEQINKTYFNNQDFKFTWSTSEEYGYDDFWTEPNENGEYKGKLNVSGLATSGMMINGKLLSDILTKAGKISLSGGSASLHGKTKTSGNDSHPWKLTIDNEEVDKNAIEWKLISPTNEKLPDTISINNGVVSWTDKIEAKTYNFSVLAICKETKIQSPLITLTISSSEQSENVENFNYNLKNTLYDENTIDQKLLDFVNNVDFSLDYTEKDYDAVKDGKKGEILINDIIIGYKNSKNTFKVSNSDTKEAISKAINNDSGVTKRFSNNLYKSIKNHFSEVLTIKSLYGKFGKDTVENLSNDFYEKWDIMQKISAVFAIIATVCLAALIIYSVWSWKSSTLKGLKKLFSLIAIGFSYALLITCFVLLSLAKFIDIDGSLDKLNKFTNWDKQVAPDDEFYVQICDDTNYFSPTDDSEEAAEKCKNEFDKLSISKVKEKKWFYEQCQNEPADYEKDPDKYKKTPYGKLQKSLKHLDQVLKDLGSVYVAYISVIAVEVFAVVTFIVCFRIIWRSFKLARKEVYAENPDLINEVEVTVNQREQEFAPVDDYVDEVARDDNYKKLDSKTKEVQEKIRLTLHDRFSAKKQKINEPAFYDALEKGNIKIVDLDYWSREHAQPQNKDYVYVFQTALDGKGLVLIRKRKFEIKWLFRTIYN